MIPAMILTMVVVTICVLIHSKALRLTSDVLIPRLGGGATDGLAW